MFTYLNEKIKFEINLNKKWKEFGDKYNKNFTINNYNKIFSSFADKAIKIL